MPSFIILMTSSVSGKSERLDFGYSNIGKVYPGKSNSRKLQRYQFKLWISFQYASLEMHWKLLSECKIFWLHHSRIGFPGTQQYSRAELSRTSFSGEFFSRSVFLNHRDLEFFSSRVEQFSNPSWIRNCIIIKVKIKAAKKLDSNKNVIS